MQFSPERTVYLNGQYLPAADAKVSIFDRGYRMADAVYEFTAVVDNQLLDFEGHYQRLQRSLNELDFEFNVDRDDLLEMHRQLVARNDLGFGGVYLQVSRGVAERDFAIPADVAPTIMAFTQQMNLLEHPAAKKGLKVVSAEDGRWLRRDIKSVQLLYTSMVKTQAIKAGANDAFFVKDGYVTEATSANAFIIRDNTIITRDLSADLLHGVTRKGILKVAEKAGLAVEERPFTIAEAQDAQEVLITASPIFALPVVEVDGKVIGDGKPGKATKDLRSILIEDLRQHAI